MNAVQCCVLVRSSLLSISLATHWRFLAAVMLGIVLTGCATGKTKYRSNEASYIDYQLPITAAQITLDATLEECFATQPIKDAGLSAPLVRGTVSISPISQGTPFPEHRFRLEGANLASFTKKRDIKIDVYPNGALKTINSSVSDRTGAIIAGVLKLAAAFALDDGKASSAAGACNPTTATQLANLKKLRSEMDHLRASLSTRATDLADAQERMDVLAAEMAHIQTKYLSLKLVRNINFSDSPGAGLINWTALELKEWFDYEKGHSKDVMPNFQVAWCAQRVMDSKAPCNKDLLNSLVPTAKPLMAATIDCAKDGVRCPQTLVLREPSEALVTIVALGTDVKIDAPNAVLAKATIPIAQWGDISYLPLQVGFGGSKTVALSLDEFGRKTSFGWGSGARGEEILGGIQGIAENAIALNDLRSGADLKSSKAEIEELETQQKLNKLRKCEAILEAGGFVCPDQ